MEFQEVQNCFFKYESKRHDFLQETQSYYLKRGFQPYVWFDKEHKPRIKIKYRRGLENFVLTDNNKERHEFISITEEFCKKNNIRIKFICDFCETNMALPKDVQSQWSTEIIFEV